MTLTPEGYRPRIIDERFQRCLKTFGAVYVRGPRNCGKTWTSRNNCNSEIQLTPDVIRMVSTDRSLALEGDAPHLIDEWQAVPLLWDDVRFDLDRTGKKGQYILCGSHSISKDEEMKQVHSGIGRIDTIDMHTMSLFESGDSDGSVSLKGLFDDKFVGRMGPEIRLKDLIRLTSRGGWPSLLSKDVDPWEANTGYIKRLCEVDVIRIDGVQRSSHKMRMLLRSLARNESTVVKNSTLKRDLVEFDDETISESTVSDYIEVLERLNMLWYQPSFDPCPRSSLRVGKKPKRHLADPSLSMAALGLTPEAALKDLETFGFMFEALCERDLLIYAEANGGTLYHYRDQRNEIDAVVEMADGRWGAFEIKLGFDAVDAAAANLVRMSSKFVEEGGKAPAVMCVICGMSRAAYRREDGVYVMPITMLRERCSREHY